MGSEAANGRDGWAGQLLCCERGGEKPWLLPHKVHRNVGRASPAQGAQTLLLRTTGQQPPAGWDLASLSCPHLPVCPVALHFSSNQRMCAFEGGVFFYFFLKRRSKSGFYFFCQAKRKHSRLALKNCAPPGGLFLSILTACLALRGRRLRLKESSLCCSPSKPVTTQSPK